VADGVLSCSGEGWKQRGRLVSRTDPNFVEEMKEEQCYGEFCFTNYNYKYAMVKQNFRMNFKKFASPKHYS
jgi:hypothetical protein